MELPTSAWKELRHHAVQQALWRCPARFVVVEAGRRSGKTQIAKYDAVRSWMANTKQRAWLGVMAAPTRDQAKQIFWQDLKELCPTWCVESISESELKIRSVHGNTLRVVGMDKPQRVEGRPIDKFWCDEMADMKPNVWDRHIRPALSTPDRPGSAWFFGVPRPSSQFKELADIARDPKNQPEWSYFHWRSIEVCDPHEVEAAKRTLDPLIFAQEYEAERVNFAGRAYYQFDRAVHAQHQLPYDKTKKLIVSLDFNNAPGVACVMQEGVPPRSALVALGDKVATSCTLVIGEVWIKQHSNSDLVANKIAHDWKDHEGQVELHGDASGGQHHSSSVNGSDWDIVERSLRRTFGGRLRVAHPSANPPVRSRVNAVNARLMAADGVVRLLVSPTAAPHVAESLDGMLVLEGTAGELDKSPPDHHSHMTDALGYYVEQRFPVSPLATGTIPLAL